MRFRAFREFVYLVFTMKLLFKCHNTRPYNNDDHNNAVTTTYMCTYIKWHAKCQHRAPPKHLSDHNTILTYIQSAHPTTDSTDEQLCASFSHDQLSETPHPPSPLHPLSFPNSIAASQHRLIEIAFEFFNEVADETRHTTLYDHQLNKL